MLNKSSPFKKDLTYLDTFPTIIFFFILKRECLSEEVGSKGVLPLENVRKLL